MVLHKRIARDGNSYSFEEYSDFYGRKGQQMWDESRPSGVSRLAGRSRSSSRRRSKPPSAPSSAHPPRPPESEAWPGGVSGISQLVDHPSGPRWVASHACTILCDKVLNIVYQDILDATSVAHVPRSHPRPQIDTNRIVEMRSKTFSNTINSLERAYCKHLHETIEHQYSTDIAAAVRNLHDAVMHKLKVNCAEEANEGERIVQDMLGHCLEEFNWDHAAQVLQEATSRALQKKAEAYELGRTCRERAKCIRRSEK